MANKWSAINIGQPPGAIKAVNDHLIIYVSTTGDDDSGDGSLSNPYKTPHRAMTRAKDFYIGEDGKVTIKCAAGQYDFTTSLILNHPQGEKIHIVGADAMECGHVSNDTDGELKFKGAYGVTFGFDTTDTGGTHKIKLLAGREVSGENSGFTTEHGLTKGHEGSWLQIYPVSLWNKGVATTTSPLTYGKASLYDREWGSGNTSGGLKNNSGWKVNGTGNPGGSGGMQWKWAAGCHKITAVTGGAARLHHNPSGADAGPQGNNAGSHIQIDAIFRDGATEPRVNTERTLHKRSHYNDPREYADNVNNQGGVVNDDTTKNIGLISTYSVPYTDGHTSGWVASSPDEIHGRILKTVFNWSTYENEAAIVIRDYSAFGSLKNIVFLRESHYNNGVQGGTCIRIENDSVLSPYDLDNDDEDKDWTSDSHSCMQHCVFMNFSTGIYAIRRSNLTMKYCTFQTVNTAVLGYYNCDLSIGSCAFINGNGYFTNTQYSSSAVISNTLFHNAQNNNGSIYFDEAEEIPSDWSAGDYIFQFTTDDDNAKFSSQGKITSINRTTRLVVYKPIVDVWETDTNPPSLHTNFHPSRRLYVTNAHPTTPGTPPDPWEDVKSWVATGTYATSSDTSTFAQMTALEGSGPYYTEHANFDQPTNLGSRVRSAADGHMMIYRSRNIGVGRAGSAGYESHNKWDSCVISGMGGYGFANGHVGHHVVRYSTFCGIGNNAGNSWLNGTNSIRESALFQVKHSCQSVSHTSVLYSFNNFFVNSGNFDIYLSTSASGYAGSNHHYIGRDGMLRYPYRVVANSSISMSPSKLAFPLFTNENLITRAEDGAKIPKYTKSTATSSARQGPTPAFPCANPLITQNPYVISTGSGEATQLLAVDAVNNRIAIDQANGIPTSAWMDNHSTDDSDIGTDTIDVLGRGFQTDDGDDDVMDGWVAYIDNTSIEAGGDFGTDYTYTRTGSNPVITFFD